MSSLDTQKPLGSYPVHAKWKPHARRNTGKPNNQRVHKHLSFDGRTNVLILPVEFIDDTNRNRLPRVRLFVVVKLVEQLREPHHKCVVTATEGGDEIARNLAQDIPGVQPELD